MSEQNNSSEKINKTKKVSNTSNNKEKTEEQKFWDHYRIYKDKRLEDPMVAIDSAEWLQKNIKVDKLDKNGQYYEFITKFIDGKRVITKDGRMVWVYGDMKDKDYSKSKNNSNNEDE